MSSDVVKSGVEHWSWVVLVYEMSSSLAARETYKQALSGPQDRSPQLASHTNPPHRTLSTLNRPRTRT